MYYNSFQVTCLHSSEWHGSWNFTFAFKHLHCTAICLTLSCSAAIAFDERLPAASSRLCNYCSVQWHLILWSTSSNVKSRCGQLDKGRNGSWNNGHSEFQTLHQLCIISPYPSLVSIDWQRRQVCSVDHRANDRQVVLGVLGQRHLSSATPAFRSTRGRFTTLHACMDYCNCSK